MCGQDIDGSVERTLNIHIAPLSQPSLSNCSNPLIADNCQGLKICDLDIDWRPRGPDLAALGIRVPRGRTSGEPEILQGSGRQSGLRRTGLLCSLLGFCQTGEPRRSKRNLLSQKLVGRGNGSTSLVSLPERSLRVRSKPQRVQVRPKRPGSFQTFGALVT